VCRPTAEVTARASIRAFKGASTTKQNLGMVRNLDTIRNLFSCVRPWAGPAPLRTTGRMQMQRLPQREDGYTLDLDSTVF